MKTLNPYLSLSGRCREAMTFYRDCFGGELSFLTVGESPMPCESSPEAAAQIMHSTLRTEAGIIMATDMTGPDDCQNAPAMSIALDCSTGAEQAAVFAKLEQAGTVRCAVAPAFWGGTFGCVTDRFGVTWLLTHSPEAPA